MTLSAVLDLSLQKLDSQSVYDAALDFSNTLDQITPAVIAVKAANAIKAAGYPSIRAAYRRVLDEQLYDFGTSEKGTRVTAYQNAVRTAMVEAFNAAFDAGYTSTSGAPRPPDDEDANYWIMERVNAEYGYIGTMMQSLKMLRDQVWAKEARVGEIKEFVEARKDGYSASLDSVNSAGKMWGIKNKTLTWQYGDTEHCSTCESLNGQRHKAKWYISRDYIPRKPGASMDCGGYRCQCKLIDADGSEITI